MELYHCHQAVIKNRCHCLLYHLDHDYATEVSVFLWYQYNGIPSTLFHEVTLAEGGLDQADNLLLMGGVSYSSLCAPSNQDRIYSVLILDGNPTLFWWMQQTAQATLYSSGMKSFKDKGVSATRMLRPVGGAPSGKGIFAPLSSDI